MTEPGLAPVPVGEGEVDDCWNRIGVRGDGSCSELERHIHCRNCPVHGSAALSLLDREPAPELAEAWATQFARRESDDSGDVASVLVFRLGQEWLGLPTSMVAEVAALRTIHSLPWRRGGAVLGVANVHGELVACLSLSLALGLTAVAPTVENRSSLARGRLLVLRRDDVRAACPVDEVAGIQRITGDALQAPPPTLAATAACVLRVWSWQARSVGLLDDGLLARVLARSLA